ncbi:MAG: DEAD/DEAH box helicase [Caldilineaceae bacterium]
MSTQTTPTTLRRRLRRTWSPFFAHHGHLTAVQQHAIPHLLDGRSTLVIAATAAGKTEAAVAPLVERLFSGGRPHKNELAILYICPTRALTRPFERLRRPLDELHIALAMKTGDTAPISAKTPPTLIADHARIHRLYVDQVAAPFIHLRALVIDEVHLFDGTPRGDHLRCLAAPHRIHSHLLSAEQWTTRGSATAGSALGHRGRSGGRGAALFAG